MGNCDAVRCTHHIVPDELLEAAEFLPLLVVPVAERRMLGLHESRRRHSVQVQVVLQPGNARRRAANAENTQKQHQLQQRIMNKKKSETVLKNGNILNTHFFFFFNQH